jgi:ribA/ribD-fused uncharacterized protein
MEQSEAQAEANAEAQAESQEETNIEEEEVEEEVEEGEINVNTNEENVSDAAPLIREKDTISEDKYIRMLKSFYSERLEYFTSQRKSKLLKSKLKKGDTADISDLLASMGIFKQETITKKGVTTKKLTLRHEPAIYEPGGNVAVEMDGEYKTIEIPPYRPPTEAETLTIQETYDKTLAEQVAVFEVAREELRAAIAADRNVLKAQRAVHEADLRLQSLRFSERGVQSIPSIEMRHILFDQPQNISMIDIGAFIVSRLPVQTRYVADEQLFVSEEALKEVEESKAPPKEAMLIFSIPENEYGELSSWAPASFKLGPIRYNNAYQAIMARLAEELDRDEEADAIRATDSAEAVMAYETIKESEAEEVWRPLLEGIVLEVNRAKFEQNPELAEILNQTGDALLVFVPPENPKDTFLGVGLPMESVRIKNKEKWRGERVFGKALELIRGEGVGPSVSLVSKAAPSIKTVTVLPTVAPVANSPVASSTDTSQESTNEPSFLTRAAASIREDTS